MAAGCSALNGNSPPQGEVVGDAKMAPSFLWLSFQTTNWWFEVAISISRKYLNLSWMLTFVINCKIYKAGCGWVSLPSLRLVLVAYSSPCPRQAGQSLWDRAVHIETSNSEAVWSELHGIGQLRKAQWDPWTFIDSTGLWFRLKISRTKGCFYLLSPTWLLG